MEMKIDNLDKLLGAEELFNRLFSNSTIVCSLVAQNQLEAMRTELSEETEKLQEDIT